MWNSSGAWLRTGVPFLGVLMLAGCGEQSEPPQGAGVVEVGVVTLTTAAVELRRELAGRTRASVVAEVRPQVGGIIQRQLYEEGSQVRAGQALYQIDAAVYRAELNTARAGLARAEAAAVAARQQARRAGELVKTGAISRQDAENSTAALGQAEAEVAAANAQVEAAQLKLGYARIITPIGGRIGRSAVTPGALVTANQDAALATVQQLDPIQVDLMQSSSEWLALQRDLAAGRLERGDQLAVNIVLEDGTAYPHAGRLQFSEVSVDPTTGSYALRVVVPNPDGLLLPGMYVRALVDVGVRPQGVLAPQQGITRDAKGNAVAMVVSDEGLVEARSVRVSRTVGDHWLVEDGLAAGDKLVVAGLQKISPGAAVTAVETDLGAADAGNGK
jgi:membrane fusion protein (multidrug efflux system)